MAVFCGYCVQSYKVKYWIIFHFFQDIRMSILINNSDVIGFLITSGTDNNVSVI